MKRMFEIDTGVASGCVRNVNVSIINLSETCVFNSGVYVSIY
jgi:hypothetical protein